MRLYTRTGDAGETGLHGSGRVRKSDLRIEALGAADEANAALGVARTFTRGEMLLDPILEGAQHRLFDLGADLASPGQAGRVRPDHVQALEAAIDRLDDLAQPLRTFILPGGSDAAAALHMARAVARRAERALVRLMDGGGAVDPEALIWLNRLSDLLFAAGRYANRATGDVVWRPDAS